jgi:hypothetical protein
LDTDCKSEPTGPKPQGLLRRCAPPLLVAAVAFSFQLPFFDR